MKKIILKLLTNTYGFSTQKRIRNLMLRIILSIDNGWYWSSTIRFIYQKYHHIKIGYGTYGGAFNLENIPEGTEFGNYCSIASKVYIFSANHSKEYFSTHPLFCNPMLGFVKNDLLKRTKLKIGHDVWIGQNAIILPSVDFVGNGAIIGAGAVVTKNVEPYHIVAGNPAKVIGVRFSANVIEDIEKSKWWELKKDDLIKNKEVLELITKKS